MAAAFFLVVILQIFTIHFVRAADPDPVQDFCVGNVEAPMSARGLPCKPLVTALDFVSHLLKAPGIVENRLGSVVTSISANNFPALNTQGISIQRFTYAAAGVIPPHVHPRASELLYVVEGRILAGFVSSDNRLFQQTLEQGDLFIFPRGLIHFSVNLGETPAIALASFNSQNPGTAILPNALFASMPSVPAAVLGRTFALSPTVMEGIRLALKAILAP